jgi:23S rRNA U2552 (ribose-2'-O)-methylase RlmE/FtsJ
MKTLNEIYQNYSSPEGHGDKGTAHSYIEEYSRLLEPYRHNSTVLEIGLYSGESLRMWDEYFVDSNVVGVDITSVNLDKKMLDGKYNILIGDATKESFLDMISEQTFDVIIDDGSHNLSDQIKSFTILKNKINNGGMYIIEDVLNIDNTKEIFSSLHNNVEIIDNRHIKNRYDDVLIVYKF